MSISSFQAERQKKRQKADAALAEACWVDRMRPVTPGETMAWSAYLKLPQPAWRPAREMFRRAFDGEQSDMNLMRFLTEAHVEDASLVSAIEVALSVLEKEAALYERWSGKRGR
jgi:hypothetical protein